MRDLALMLAGSAVALALTVGAVLVPIAGNVLPAVIGLGVSVVGLIVIELIGRSLESR
jgi:hypothetical protein